jgi:transposase
MVNLDGRRSIALKSIKPKPGTKLNEKRMIVAVDIGKQLHFGYIRGAMGQEIKPFSFHNSGYSFRELWAKICEFQSLHEYKEIVFGFESTGPYGEPLIHFMRKKAVNMVQVNPMHSKRLRELTGNSPNKTDKKDPRVIADVIELGHALTLVIPEGVAAQLRRLTGARERSIQSRTSMMNQLQHLVFVIFPEFIRIMKNLSSKTAFYLITHHPLPEDISSLDFEELYGVVRKVSRGKMRDERIEALYQAAKDSVGIDEGRESIVQEIQHLVSQIERENQFIEQVESQLVTYLEQIPYSRSLLSIKGFGPITVAGLIGEVGDFRKFGTISEIMKLAGLDLYEISSGKRKGQRRISKRGRPLMRKLLYFGALNVVRQNGIMHERYQQMLVRGMPKTKALIAISRRLLRLVFALVRDNAVYIENFSKHGEPLAA